jgi:hypothetical protein
VTPNLRPEETTVIDLDGIRRFLSTACAHYEDTAPTVTAHLDDLYLRMEEAPQRVSLAELLGVLPLCEEGAWEHPNHAASRIYHLRDRLGMTTEGQAGF